MRQTHGKIWTIVYISGRRRPPRPSPSSSRYEWHTTPSRTPCYGQPRRRSRRNADPIRDEAIFGIRENATTVGAVALGTAAPTTAVGVAAVAEAAEARLGQVVEQDAVMKVVLETTTGEVVVATLVANMVDAGAARQAVYMDMAPRAPSVRRRIRAPTMARSRW